MGEPKAGGHETAFSLKVLSGKLDFKGTVSEVSANAEVKGHLAVSTGALTDFIAAVVRASGQAPPKFDSSVVGNFTFDGGIEYTPTRLAVTDFKMSMGGETATGTLALEEGKAPSLTGHVTLAKIDAREMAGVAGRARSLPALDADRRPPPPAAAPRRRQTRPGGAGRQTCSHGAGRRQAAQRRPSPSRSRRFPRRWTSRCRSPSPRSSTARARSAISWCRSKSTRA